MPTSPITLNICTDGLTPKFTSDYPNGDRPSSVVTSGNVRVTHNVSPQNASFAMVEILAGAGFVFEAEPRKKIYLGFGLGALYSGAVDSTLGDHTDYFTGNTWDFEAARTIKDDAGYRYLQCGPAGFGMDFDSGSDIGADEYVYQSSVVRARADAVNVGGTTQWKTYRLLPPNDVGDDYNSVYFKTFDGSATTYDGGELTSYDTSGVSKAWYGGDHPTLDNIWTHSAWIAKCGDAGVANGTIIGRTIRDNGSGISEGGFDNNSYPGFGDDSAIGIKLIDSASAFRWRHIFCQDFINFTTNAVVERSDFVILVGSASRFMIADTDNPATATAAYDMVGLKLSDTKYQLRLWKGRFSSFSGKYLWYFGEADDFVFSVPLGA